MRGIALCAGVIVAALSGCAKPTHMATRPPPDPLLRTHRPAPRDGGLVAPSKRSAPQVKRRRSSVRLQERELIPRNGIKPGHWNVIVVHHSASPAATVQSMDNYHRDVRGWPNGLGYHFVIGNGVNTTDGRIYVGSRWKRQISGAHCRSKSGRYFGAWRHSGYFNTHGIGICLIGNFENDRPSQAQLAALEQLTEFLCSETGINPAHVYGHGEVTHKTACPGRQLSRELPRLRAAVARALTVEVDSGRAGR